ncbi:MAG: ABC transporter ATP-binding protein [Pseudomonadales bacterium]
MSPLLSIDKMSVHFSTPEGEVRAVRDLSVELQIGETLAVVGESGSGKSQTFLALMGLLARNGRTSGSARYRDSRDLLALSPGDLDQIRGADIGMIFQDPMTALHPGMRIGKQLCEIPQRHGGASKAQAREQALQMLQRVGIADPQRRIDLYPHELSGGMRQRVMIAMALLGRPKLLIADEPTTALDVTVQAQILELIGDLKQEFGMAVVMITHDLGVVAGLADNVMVMYAGEMVEYAPIDSLFNRPQHPYTRALLQSTPQLGSRGEALQQIEGMPPDLARLPDGCAFAPRCHYAQDICANRVALVERGSQLARCALDLREVR